MALTKTDRKIIDAAIAEKKSSPYLRAYEAVTREVEMMAAAGLTVAQIVERLRQPVRDEA